MRYECRGPSNVERRDGRPQRGSDSGLTRGPYPDDDQVATITIANSNASPFSLTMSFCREGCGCIPYAENVSAVRTCNGAHWLETLAEEAPSIFSAEPVMVNIGANKGYAAPHFLSLFSQHPNATVRAWHSAIKDVARGRTTLDGEDGPRRHGFLATQMCGACGACHVSPPAPHSRDGGRVTLVEMVAANAQLLTHLSKATRLHGYITVHNMVASNQSGRAYAPKVKVGTEYASVQTSSSKRLPSNVVEQSTVDELLARQTLPQIIDVITIDTEGHDALVLEGMSAVLRQKRVTLLEFEYHSIGFWAAKRRDGRNLEQTTARLGEFGYRCWLEGSPNVYVPINQGCWRPKLERRKWSNVFCTHDARARTVVDSKAWAAFKRRRARQLRDAVARG